MLLGALTGVTVPSPSPSPSVSVGPYPQIIHTITSKSCTALHNVIMPVGYVTKKNDEAFTGMQDRIDEIFSEFGDRDGPTRADLLRLGGSKDATAGSEVDQIDPSGQDDNLLYGPDQILKAAQIDTIANDIYANVELESQFMKNSLAQYPPGADAKVDEMRQHAQNLMDLQRSLADKYENFAKTYLNNQNMAWTKDPGEREFFKAYLRALLLGEAVHMDNAGSGASNYRYLSHDQVVRIGSVADVVQGLHNEERAFAPEELDTYNECNSSHIVIETPPPSPAP
jgi:hypothetical protein